MNGEQYLVFLKKKLNERLTFQCNIHKNGWRFDVIAYEMAETLDK